MKIKKYMLAVLAGCMALAGVGCRTLTLPRMGPRTNTLGHDGIPEQEYLVGGGYKIIYRAHVDGVLYLADQNSRRLLATVSLQAGERHIMEYDVHDERLAGNLDALGIDPKQAAFQLYFVPNRH
jgi:hypothetical protein